MFATCTKYKEYKARRPQKTVFYSVVKKYLLSWLKRNEGAIPRHVEKEFRDYQKCGIHAHGFAVAECNQCNHEFIIPFSCRCRGVCPSCSTKRMVKTAAHLVDHVCPKIPYRQWVISFPWPLRKYFNVPEILQECLSIVAQEINRCLIERSPQIDGAQFGGVGFVQRFGAKLNFQPHFHFCCTDGVFGKEGDKLYFLEANLSSKAIRATENQIKKAVLRFFRRKGCIGKETEKELLKAEKSGFSLNADVHIPAFDREGLERIIRYCARPCFTSENLKWNQYCLRYRLLDF